MKNLDDLIGTNPYISDIDLRGTGPGNMYPYRHRGTTGHAAGTTFIYYRPNGGCTSYQTDSPECYFVSREGEVTSDRYEMTPKLLAQFEAIPTYDDRVAAKHAQEDQEG